MEDITTATTLVSGHRRVNNLATFLSTFLGEYVARLLTLHWAYSFHSKLFFASFVFFNNLIFPAERRIFLKKQKSNETKVARLLTL